MLTPPQNKPPRKPARALPGPMSSPWNARWRPLAHMPRHVRAYMHAAIGSSVPSSSHAQQRLGQTQSAVELAKLDAAPWDPVEVWAHGQAATLRCHPHRHLACRPVSQHPLPVARSPHEVACPPLLAPPLAPRLAQQLSSLHLPGTLFFLLPQLRPPKQHLLPTRAQGRTLSRRTAYGGTWGMGVQHRMRVFVREHVGATRLREQ